MRPREQGLAARGAAAVVFMVAAATGLNAAVPFGGGAVSAFDVLTLLLLLDFAVTAARGRFRRTMGSSCARAACSHWR